MCICSASGQDRAIQLHFQLTEIEILIRSGPENVHPNYRKDRGKTGHVHLGEIPAEKQTNPRNPGARVAFK